MSSYKLPGFSSVLKSRDVEDPINLYLHRPLAYGLVALVYRTPITPNQITFLALVVGVLAGILWAIGTPSTMVAGGVILWISAILDGADGILARAKNMQSQFGRALDGSADMIVAAASLFGGFTHLWMQHHNVMHLAVGIPATVFTLFHLDLYDYYKESFLRMTQPGRGGEGEDVAQVEQRLSAAKANNASLITRVSLHSLLSFVRAQRNLINFTNPAAKREGLRFVANSRTADVYRKHNLGPMRLWAVISLSPHTYLMAISGMFDRLDIYLWGRLIVMNLIFLTVLIWQRRASLRTLADLRSMGAEPIPVGVPA